MTKVTNLHQAHTNYSDDITVPGVNLKLTVTNQEEFKGLVEATRTELRKRSDVFATASSTLNDRKREALYEDLAAALAVAEVLLDPANVDYLINILDEHNIPMVVDAEKRNEYVPITRLLWGYWPKPTDTKPDPEFTYSRSTELYAKVLRGAAVRKIKSSELVAKLKEENGFKQFKDADDKKYLKSDEGEAEKKALREDVLKDEPIAVVPKGRIKASAKDGENLVCLLGRVTKDGQVEILQQLPSKHDALLSAIDRLPKEMIKDIRTRKGERENSEQGAFLSWGQSQDVA
ncbi:hypothetical protein [Sphingobium yanoikuyae]|uniref:hypothetical protein n=1 Tax=Sphingobium yanoikuyae TaxID=13690 RepID=UPI0028AFE63E|nr:hypothetical protein [Sphingobium yanoikuyae]